MLTILSYAECQITHRIYLKFSYCIHGVEATSEGWYENEIAARDYEMDCRRSLLLGLFCDWVMHKVHISEHSDYYKNNTGRVEALARMVDAAKKLHEYSLQAVADMILQSRGMMETILPSPNNDSYQSSIDNLKEIMEEAEQTIALFKKTKAA